ncbi:hypothetical protein BDP27DRAFT_935573 [Rhodocollybia butyracea]|uniref:Uncharacterized protein n=1 Tax=Rhodocollybia butyracea TaxID=206335 RepID=A0A9P5PS50_9AGAR|nr:hypothetical protein BDP27DRAFT_935573 [Rhodocollybia butyracea]
MTRQRDHATMDILQRDNMSCDGMFGRKKCWTLGLSKPLSDSTTIVHAYSNLYRVITPLGPPSCVYNTPHPGIFDLCCTLPTEALNTMREHPELLKLLLFTSATPARVVTMASNLSVHGPDEFERTSYHNGITGDDGHPDLVYRLDYLTMAFPKPVGRFTNIPAKHSAESSTPRSIVSGTLLVPRFVTLSKNGV